MRQQSGINARDIKQPPIDVGCIDLKTANTSYIFNKLFQAGPPLIFLAYLSKWLYGLIKDGTVTNDFLVFWIASCLAEAGKAALIYDFSFFMAALECIIDKQAPLAWFYPPTYFLFLSPFSYLPYLTALVSWLFVTLSFFVLVMRRVAPHPYTIWLTLAYPASLLNFGYGQNGFLSAALLGGGLLLIKDSPFIAGLIFGLVTYKPHFAILLPIAFIAGRQWKVLIAFLLSSVTMILLSMVLWGFDTWVAFLQNIPISTRFLEEGHQGWIQDRHKMTSILSAVLLTGIPMQVAAVVQAVAMSAVIVIVSVIWFKNISMGMKASVLALCTLLFTPHLLEYDLTILALPVAWISWAGYTKGWLSGEKSILIVAWFTPLLSLLVLKIIAVQIVPVLLVVLLCLTLRRIGRAQGTLSMTDTDPRLLGPTRE